MGDQYALDSEIDRLFDLLSLERGVLLALKDMKVDAKRLGLARDARLVGLEVISLGEIADQRKFDVGGPRPSPASR
jgi:hypothetical protein